MESLRQKMRPKVVTEAETLKRSWAEDVGPKMHFYVAAVVEATICVCAGVVSKICFMR
jgi:hypothetical protein